MNCGTAEWRYKCKEDDLSWRRRKLRGAKSKAGGFQACQDSNPDLCARGGEGGGGTPGNSWWGCAAGFSKSWPYFRTKNVIFQSRFQTWPLGRNYVSIILRLEAKKFLKFVSNSHISLSLLLIWNWNDKYVHTLPLFPRKPYLIPDQNGQSVYPFPDQNGAKTLPGGQYIPI